MKCASEEIEQIALCQWLDLEKIPYFAVPNGGKRDAIEAKNMKRAGVKAGVSDLVIMLPERILFLELKRKTKGVVSKEQKKFLGMVNEYPYAVGVVAHGWIEAKAMVEYYKELK